MSNAATLPPSGTTPAGNEPGQSNPPAQAPAQSTGAPSEGQVTISTKEYAELQRAKARTLSFEKRKAFATRQQQGDQNANLDPNDAATQAIAEANRKTQEAEQRAMRAEISGKVRDLLDKEDFKALPKSTRDLILKNPALLSNADNAEEALLDIEDFVREQVAGLTPPAQNPTDQKQTDPKGHETPATVSAGSPAPATQTGLENTDGLRGVALSRAVLRNKLRQAGVRK